MLTGNTVTGIIALTLLITGVFCIAAGVHYSNGWWLVPGGAILGLFTAITHN